jgi:hypothetical protein
MEKNGENDEQHYVNKHIDWKAKVNPMIKEK